MTVLKKSNLQTQEAATAESAVVFEYIGARPKSLPGALISGPWSNSRAIEVSIHDTVEGLERVWRGLEAEGDATAFQSFAWISAWQRHIGARKGVRPCVVVGWSNDGKAQFILPLGIQKHFMTRRLTWLGAPLCDYQGPLLAESFSRQISGQFARLWADIRAMLPKHDLVMLGSMPEKIGQQTNPFLSLKGVSAHASSAHLTMLKPDWQDYYSEKRSSGSKKRDKQKRRKVEELGKVEFVVPQTVEQKLASFDALVAQKSRAFERMGIANFLNEEGHLDFYRELLSSPTAGDLLQVSHLSVNGDIVAATCGLSFQKRFCYVLTSYDEAHEASRFGPGMIQLMDLMAHACKTGHDIFDFTVGDEAYKDQWCEVEVPLFDHMAADGLAGQMALLPHLAYLRAKRFIKQNPLLWGWFTRARTTLAALPSPRGAGI